MMTLSHIGLRYDGGPEILSDISLSVEEGSYHYLTGASGSGKTTLMKLLSLGILPSRGDVTMFGKDVMPLTRHERAETRRHIGVIFQDFRLLPHLSLYDNIAMPLRLADIPEGKIKSAVTEMANWIGLKDYMHSKPPFLSGGQQQRVAIARAVITKPKILIADEPTGSLDPAVSRQIMTLFEHLHKAGTAIIVATHDKTVMQDFPHDTWKLRAGHLIE